VLAVVKYQLLREENRWRLQPAGFDVFAGVGGLFPTPWLASIVTGFVAFHFFYDAGVADRGRSAFDQHLIAVQMVAMMVRIKGEPDRLIGDGANLTKDILSAGGVAGVDHKDVIVKDYPAVVRSVRSKIGLMEIDISRYEIRFADLGGGPAPRPDRWRADHICNMAELRMNRRQTQQRPAAFEDVAPGDRTHIGILSANVILKKGFVMLKP